MSVLWLELFSFAGKTALLRFVAQIRILLILSIPWHCLP